MNYRTNMSLVILSAFFLSVILIGCGGGSASTGSEGTTVVKTSSGQYAASGSSFKGTAARAETFCFNGKCNTCNTTDNLTLTLDEDKVRITAEGPVLTFPSCSPEPGVSNNEWTLQGSFIAGGDGSGKLAITGCKGETVSGAKWAGSGNGTIESTGKVKADLQCTGTDEPSKESDKSEWKGVALTRQ